MLKIIAVPLLAISVMTSLPIAAATVAPVRIESGLISGTSARDPAVIVYKGVPFAAPPVGKLRWRPPEPPIPWHGVRKAEKFGPVCPQPQPPVGAAMDEDCLSLNIWTSASSIPGKRPVFVWIYGGAFAVGTGSNPLFDGEGLARKDLVVVTINYRLGSLGFLATPDLSQESGHAASGNYGLLDDIAALQWVQKNIQAFGGDPSRVTIAGQSAGAGSVGLLSISPLAKGLFQRSIAESHARYPRDPELRYLSTSWRALDAAERAGVKYVNELGVHSVQELRALPWQNLVVGANVIDPDVDTGSSARPPLFRPVIDGWVLPRDYSDSYALHAQNNVAFIAGNNLDESGAVPETAFAMLQAQPAGPRPGMPPLKVTLVAYQKAATEKFGPMAQEFLRLYPASTDLEAARANNSAVRDNSRVSTFLWATEWKKGATQPVYAYFWTHAPPGRDHDTRGAYHGSEINYVFDNLYATDLPWTADDRRIADTMSSLWANFAKSGDPNGVGLAHWNEVSAGIPAVMELGDHFGSIPAADAERFEFWKRFFASQAAW
jgi:para-nitrobenzyl esterase